MQGLRIILLIIGFLCLGAGLRLLGLVLLAVFFFTDYSVIPTIIFGIIGALLTPIGIILLWIVRRIERDLDIKEIQNSLKRRIRRPELPPIKWE